MQDNIQVRDVIEKNDCAGKKYIYVTAMESDELISSKFRLTSAYMPAHEKLAIASVAPMDKVSVLYDYKPSNPLMVGEYFDNLEDISKRDPLCKCGSLMVSDGFDVYCPNDCCALTLATRFERLAETSFFLNIEFEEGVELQWFNHHDISITDQMYLEKPFMSIQHGLFWGEPGGSLEHTLLTKAPRNLSLATFLVKPLFEDFIEYRQTKISKNILNFYGEMDDLINRRDLDSLRQNKLLFEFLWSLGIESLSEDHIRSLINYEKILGNTSDPMVFYAYVFTHPKELIEELGIHYLEASAIYREISRRKYEFCDIFSHYALNEDDVDASFDRLIPIHQI